MRSQVHPAFAVGSKAGLFEESTEADAFVLSSELKIGQQVSNLEYKLDTEQRRLRNSAFLYNRIWTRIVYLPRVMATDLLLPSKS